MHSIDSSEARASGIESSNAVLTLEVENELIFLPSTAARFHAHKALPINRLAVNTAVMVFRSVATQVYDTA